MAQTIYPKWLKIIGIWLNIYNFFLPNKAAKTTLNLFCKPRGGKIKDFHAKFLSQFEQKLLPYQDFHIQTYYLYKGYQHTILMAHGWESNSARWKKMIKHLEDLPMNIVMLDGPAHGNSGSEYFNGLLYSEMINQVCYEFKVNTVMGHSIGGFSTILASKHNTSNHLKNLIILASPNKMTEITDQFFDVIGLGSAARQSYTNNFLKWFGQPMTYYEASRFIAGSKLPGIIIHDKDDNINRYHNGEEIFEAWPAGSLITTEGLGHGLQSKLVFEEVKKYLSSVI